MNSNSYFAQSEEEDRLWGKWKGLLEITFNWFRHGAALSRNTVRLQTCIMLIESFPDLTIDYCAISMQNIAMKNIL